MLNDEHFNSTKKPGEEDKPKEAGIDQFIRKIKANTLFYTGTIIDGRVVVGDPITKTGTTQVCSMTEDKCESPVNIDILQNFATIQVLSYTAVPLFFTGPLEDQDCKAGGIDHEFINVTFEKAKDLECDQCKSYDAIVCKDKLAGIIVESEVGGKFKFINIDTLRSTGAAENSGDDDFLDELANSEKTAVGSRDKKDDPKDPQKLQRSYGESNHIISKLALINVVYVLQFLVFMI